jgi:outer membrane protein assembly factor BamB
MVANGSFCVFPTRQTRLTCLHTQTGAEQWQVKVLSNSPWLAVTEHYVYYLHGYGYALLSAFDIRSGATVWERGLPEWQGWLHAHAHGLLLGGWRAYTDISCVDPNTGDTTWTYSAQWNSKGPERALLRTAIYAPLKAVVVVYEDGIVEWYSLADRTLLHSLTLPSLLIDQQVDCPANIPVGDQGHALLLRHSKTKFYRISGEHIHVRFMMSEAKFIQGS